MIAREIFDKYDILLVDVFGVIWNGVDWIPDTLDTLKQLKASGKTVIILSNASVSTEYMLSKYSISGAKKEEHFSEFVTSGEVLNNVLQNNSLAFESIKDPKTYTILGSKNCYNFDNTNYKYVDSLDDADFVYVSIPQFTNEQKLSLPSELQQFLYVSNMRSTEEILWDAVSVKPFISELEKIFLKRKPLLIANPDKFASVGVRKSFEDQQYVIQFVVRQGSIGEEYIKLGGEVCFIGKPYPLVYEFALNLAAKSLNIPFNKLRDLNIAMIGDTLETDILGAKNATTTFEMKIDSILVKTGIAHKDMSLMGINGENANDVKTYCKSRNIVPDHVIEKLSLDVEVLF